MNLGMHQSVSMKMEQKLAPQMIQSVKILQTNSVELEQLVSQEMLINPLIEIGEEYIAEERDFSEDDLNSPKDEDYEADREVDWEREFMDDYSEEEKQWEDKPQEQDNYYDGPDLAVPDPDLVFERTPVRGKLLSDLLLEQLKFEDVDADVFAAAHYLINSLDDDGYLSFNAEDFKDLPAEKMALPPKPILAATELMIRNGGPTEDTPPAVIEALEVLRDFDPAGVGAFNLREGLLLQAERLSDFSPLAFEILENHFDLFLELKYAEIAKILEITEAEVKSLVQEDITRLTLSPGFLMGEKDYFMKIPEMTVELDENGAFAVRLLEGHTPKIRVSETYKQLLKDKNLSREDKRYIREKLQAADLLVQSVGQRRATMLRVMNVILQKQINFFEKGPGHLKPMILQDVADEIGIHPSTVNRATNGKFVQTQFGLMELKDFFSSSVSQDDGTEISAELAKNAIKDLIAGEDKAKPLSDQKIVDLLAEKELKLARRTVAKYREQMGIFPSRIRKKL